MVHRWCLGHRCGTLLAAAIALNRCCGGAVAVMWLVIAVWVIAFFRDPVRTGERGDRFILAPADGKVVSVLETRRARVLQGSGRPGVDLHERLQLPCEPLPDRRHG